MRQIQLVTLGLVRELGSGDSVVVLAADPTRASFGDEDDALLEARLFLAEHLARSEPEVVARFALPEGSRIHTTDVDLQREDLPRRWNIDRPISIASLLLPTPPNPRGKRDTWVMVLPLLHTFFLSADDNLDEEIAREVKRIVAARELGPLDWLDLLPPPRERVVPIETSFQRGGGAEIAAGVDHRKRIAEHETNKAATAVLASIGAPMHAGLHPGGDPRPFPLRDREIGLLRSMLATEERASVLLVGPEQVGKSGLFRAWLEREWELNRPRVVYQTSGARLLAGMSGFGQWQERVRRVMEAAARLDAVLYFDDLTDLFAEGAASSIDIPTAMRRFLEDGKVRVVGEIREDGLDRALPRNAGFFACFGRVRLQPLDAPAARRVLDELSTVHRARYPERPVLGAAARATLIDLAERYLPYESFPGKAVRLDAELRAAEELAGGSTAPREITADAVHLAFSVRTGVPLFLLRDDHALRIDDVFAKLRTRLVGQDHAVRRVAELVGVAKAGLQPAGKPLATLLFAGPTGVGKTELARALAELLFGSEDRLVRFDMSEYASAFATERLFRGADGGEGLLTRKVREQPFSVVLLDEIEKAHPAAFDLLLQICGEGRLTDGRGKTAWFHNAILVMTSNLGATRRQTQGFGASDRPAEDDARYETIVRQTFRPELVNRIDRIVAFRSLDRADIGQVTRIALARAARRRGLVERVVDVQVSDAATERLAEGGMSAAYGARALRRHIERAFLAPAARLLSRRVRGTGDRLVVTSIDEPTRPGAVEEQQGGLRFVLEPVPTRRGGRSDHALDTITDLRRETHRQLLLDRVVELKEHADYLVAQLAYGSEKKKKSAEPPRDGALLAQMTAEHARLAEIVDALEAAFQEICAIEELALVGFVAGDPLAPLLPDAELARGRFRATLARALVARETRRDQATVMVTELDAHRGLDRWLVPLLVDAERRKWTIELHVDGDRTAPQEGWPEGRRWGPPRSAAWMLERLAARDRTFRSVLVHVSGDHAGVWLALEGGLHRLPGLDGPPPDLHVDLIALRFQLTAPEWVPPALDPPLPTAYAALSRERPVRNHADGRIDLAGTRSRIELPFAEYWPRFEEIALAHLLVFESDASLDRDQTLRPRNDDELAPVRVLARQNRKLEAIKLYRELIGSSLREAKDAVEAMT